MIPLIRNQLFASLSSNAKTIFPKVEEATVLPVSPKNLNRIKKLRQSKRSEMEIKKLKQELYHHRNVNSKLTKDIDVLKKTVELFASTIETHDSRMAVASNILERKTILGDLSSELDDLTAVALDVKKDGDISDEQWVFLSDYVDKLRSMIHKKEADIDASMLL